MLGLGGVLLLASAEPAAAGAAKIVSCPFLITAPGTYVLAADLSCSTPGGNGITIQASGVRLVLGNHTITGQASSFAGSEVSSFSPVPVTGVKIEGGTVTGFGHTGIEVDNASGVRISGTTVSGDNTGIALTSCTGCQVVGNRVSDNTVGILVAGGGLNTQISGNTITGNGDAFGIEVARGTAGVRLTGNVVTDNGAADLYDGNLDPTAGTPACVNTWRGNRFTTDNETGAASGPGAGCIR
jgi:parallel beta-helix repeat protein